MNPSPSPRGIFKMENLPTEENDVDVDENVTTPHQECVNWCGKIQKYGHIQEYIDEIESLIKSHKVKTLTDEEKRKSNEWNEEFRNSEDGKSMLAKVKNFHCKPSR